jgi:hypothetical protein
MLKPQTAGRSCSGFNTNQMIWIAVMPRRNAYAEV